MQDVTVNADFDEYVDFDDIYDYENIHHIALHIQINLSY